ncbi:MAG TPA: TetR/AcrR family transcriptional regulator [Polyangia bacterium]|jgi:TetR/AcrR family transcriptional repressor of nem operon
MPRSIQKAASHEAIVTVAADLIRRYGIAAASVARVMQGAGLTVGGFYAHFATKSHLAGAALRRAFADNMSALFTGLEGASRAQRYDQAVRRYLSRQHRDMERQICPVPACLSEIDPRDAPVRDALVDGVDDLVGRLTPLLDARPGLTARQRALGTAATLIGALALARASRGTAWSDEVLLAARKLLFALEGDHR